MKKILVTILTAALISGSISACGSQGAAGSETNNSETAAAEKALTETDASQAPASDAASSDSSFSIVTTIFPEYDWVSNILGENPAGAETTILLDDGVDLHSYQPTAEDIMKISTCDLFIYVGGESDEWVNDALKEATNENMIVIDLLDELGEAVKEEEVVEGMEGHDHDHEEDADDHEHDAEAEDHDHDAETDDHDHEADADDHEHEHEEDEVEYDEHVWLSLKNTKTLVSSIASALESVDPDNAEAYKANADEYISKLSALDAEYEKVTSGAARDVLLFGDRFPFRYLTDDYGLTYYAAFVGCSAETEASFETITFLADKVNELSLTSVMTIEKSDHKIADTIIQNTKTKDQQVLTLDSMQSTTSKDIANGATYLSIMESNLEVLKTALN